jgi:glutathione S-transferase
MTHIYHIAEAADWERAREAGEYLVSTRGHSLAQVGFIHASAAAQVAGVANAFYRDAGELVLLVIDPARLTAPVRYEQVPGLDSPFPHIYGPLPVTAVVRVRPLRPAANGEFSFPDGG